MTFLSRALAIFLKDLALEVRSRDMIAGAVVFCLLVVLVMSFAVDPAQADRTAEVGGLLWVTLLFGSSLTLGRSIALERENGCLDVLLTSPGDRAAIFVGKAGANALVVVATSLVVLPVFGVLFRLSLAPHAPALALTVVLGSVAIAAPGTLIGTMVLETRAREMLLPILLLPLEIPCLIACVETTRTVLDGSPLADAATWLKLLVAFDVVFTTVAAALYDRLTDA